DKGFLFERKLKGGYIPAIDTYVPESIVRSLNLSHGDLVKASPKRGSHFHFDLIKKGNEENPDRAEIKYGIVEKDGDLWTCSKTLSGKSILIDESPFVIHL